MATGSKRVLLVSDSTDMEVQGLSDELMGAGFEVVRVDDALAARRHIERTGLPHLLIVDMRLPRLEGLKLCQELYDAAGLPIITLSGHSDTAEAAVEALQYADDFIRRPFSPVEATVRVRRILSRIDNFAYASGPEIRIHDNLSLDQVNRQIKLRGEVRKLTPTENALLSVLLTHRGKIVDADTLIERVWRLDPTIKDRNALRVHIHRLRNKIEDDPDHPHLILTERGIGYSFAEN